MRNSGKTAVIMLIVIAAVSLAAIADLLLMRFRLGDVYPPYSSLRTDPLGAKALFEALESMRGITVERNFREIHEPGREEDSVLLLLSTGSRALAAVSAREAAAIEEFAGKGGRVVITFRPEPLLRAKKSGECDPCASADRDAAAPPTDADADEDDEADEAAKGQLVSLFDQWQLRLSVHEAPEPVTAAGKTPDAMPERFSEKAVRAIPGGALPPSVSWHSASFFEEMGAEWKTIYTARAKAVVIERRLGAGTIVLATDSYFVSNEAMLRERHAALLAWLIGPKHRIVFDESHLGLAEQPNIASLIRAYHLHGAVAVALLLAVLFIWKNSVSLAPHLKTVAGDDDVTMGRDHRAGFVSLLRRTVPHRDLLAACITEWKRSLPERRLPRARIDEADAYCASLRDAPPDSMRQVEAYKRITKILAERGKHEHENRSA